MDKSKKVQNRSIDTTPASGKSSGTMFFPVSPLKLVVMSTVTLGIYQIYWFYKNWDFIKVKTKRDISPFWRAFFAVIFCYSCFKEIKNIAKTHGVSFPASPISFSVIWIAIYFAFKLPSPYFLIWYLTPLVLIAIQNVINNLNEIVAPDHDPNRQFSGWNITGIVVGGIFFVLVIIGSFSS